MSGRERPASARKPIKRKDKDKPKRPLSAYNFFFKEERKKILRALDCKDENYRKLIDPELDIDLVTKLKKVDGKVCFEELGKLLGRRWQAQKGKERSSYYNSLAEADTERYKLDMDAYTRRKEERRLEASRPSYDNYHPSYQMHNVMNSYPSHGMYYEPMGYMNGYYSNAVYSNGMQMRGPYHPYYRFDVPYDNNRHQNNRGSDFHNSAHAMPISYSQTQRSDSASYHYEQHGHAHYPCYQTYHPQEPGRSM